MKLNTELLLDKDYTLRTLKNLKLPFNIRQHCLKVSEKAIEIANNIHKVEVNYSFVEIGGLVHDIGRLKTHGLDHGIIGGKIARELGYPEDIAKICEKHVLGGFDEEDIQKFLPEYDSSLDLIPKTIEEKLICLVDKFFKGSKEVSIEIRFASWFKKRHRDKELLMKSKERIENIYSEIKKLIEI